MAGYTYAKGTLILAACVGEGVVVASDGLEVFDYPDGTRRRVHGKRKIVWVDDRVICAVSDLASVVLQHELVDLVCAVERGAQEARSNRTKLDFLGKCMLVTRYVVAEYNRVRAKHPGAFMDYPEETLTRL